MWLMPRLASSFPDELNVRARASKGLPTVKIILAQRPHKQNGSTQGYVTRWDAFQETEATG